MPAMPPISELETTSRRAQDSLLLLGLTVAAAGLVVAGPLLPIPYAGCIGLPLGMVAALAFTVIVLVAGRLEVAWWRHGIGLIASVVGLGVFFRASMMGLGIIAQHYLGRAGAPALSELLTPAVQVLMASLVIGLGVTIRRRDGSWFGLGTGVITALTATLAWIGLFVLALLGAPFGA